MVISNKDPEAQVIAEATANSTMTLEFVLTWHRSRQ